MREILTLVGKIDKNSQTGDCPLYSDLLYVSTVPPFTAPTKVIIPFGLKAKIWAKRISTLLPVHFAVYYSKNATADSPVWELVEARVVSSSDDIEKKRPVVLRSINGTEGFKISWKIVKSDDVGKDDLDYTYIELDVEFTDEEP